MKNKILSIFCCIVYSSLVGLIFYLIKINAISDGTEDTKYFIYITIIIIIFILLLIYHLVFFNLNNFKNLILMSVFSIISILLMEIIFDYSNFKKLIYIKNISINKNINLKKLYLKLSKNNQDLKFSFSPNAINLDFKKHFFFSNNSNAKSFLCIENSGPIIINNDKFGFNNDNSAWSQKQPYLFIGDSFVQGWCVKSKNNFVYKYNNKSLNLGVQNTGPLIQFAILKEYYRYIKPKKIIWFYYEGNDFDDLNHEKRKKILRKYLINSLFSQQLLKRQFEVDKQNDFALKKFIKFSTNSTNTNTDQNYVKYVNLKNILKLKNIRTLVNNILFKGFLYEKILVEAKKFSELNNIELIMVYLPSYERYKLKNNFIRDIHYNRILKIYKKNNLNFIDLKKDFFDKKDTLAMYPQKKRGHFNEKGHDELSQFLKINIK